MLQSLRANPVYVHLTRGAKWPSGRAAWLLFVGIAVIGSAIALAATLLDPDMSNVVGFIVAAIFTFGGLLVALLSAPTAGLLAALVTARAARSESHDLLRITALDARTLVRGYLLVALFRLRVLWIVTFGLLLPVLFATAHALSAIDMTVPFASDCYDCPPPTLQVVWPSNLLAAAQTVGGAALSGIAFNWLGVCAGVWMALQFRRSGPAIGATMGIVLALGLLVAAISVVMVTRFFWPQGVELLVLLALLAGVVAIGFAMLRRAEGRV